MLSLFKRNKKVSVERQQAPAYVEYSPRHYLQASLRLLDIYRGVGKRHEYEILAGQLHQSFNAWIEPWDSAAPTETPESLKCFPHILQRLEECWGQRDCQDYLEKLLEDNRGGSRQGFNRAVLHEIVTLITMHEELAPTPAISQQPSTAPARVRQQLAMA